MTSTSHSNLNLDSEINSSDNATWSADRPMQGPQSNRACTSCVRAKAKCSANSGTSGNCERCSRMNKLCQPSPPDACAREVNRASENRTSKLEEKLDGIVKLLNSAGRITTETFNPSPKSSTSEGSLLSNNGFASGLTAFGSQGNQGNAFISPLPMGRTVPESSYTPAASISSAASPPVFLRPLLHQNLEPSPEEAESYLNRFRTEFVSGLPLIVIPPSVTARQLRQERPVLWVCIMTVASNNTAQQIRYSREVRAILGREIFVEGNRSMDLLLAILVYAGWDRCQSPEKPLLTSLIQAAIALVYDLGLDKPPPTNPAVQLAYDLKGVARPSRLSRSQTMEERRTLLGCFLLSSVIYSFLRKGEALRWTSYADECLYILETQKEVPSDAILVQLVKLRLVSGKIEDAPWKCSVAEVFNDATPPEVFYLHSLEAQLHDFKRNIPSQLVDNNALRMELCVAELKIHEIGLTKAPGTFNGQYNRRLECLWACLNATKSWADIFLYIPPAEYFGFSLLIYANMAICLVTSYQLLAFDHSEWNRTLAQEHLNLPLILEQGEKNFLKVKEAAGLKGGDSEDIDAFTLLASRLRFARISITPSVAPTTSSLNTAQDEGMSDFPMDLFDENWLRKSMIPGTSSGTLIMQ